MEKKAIIMSKQLAFNPQDIIDKYEPDRACAYGSGAFPQEGNISKNNMIDFMFGAEDTKARHEINYAFHPQEYSGFVRTFGLQLVDALQDTGAKIYYHPFVPFQGNRIKYGVISIENIIKDLNEWSNLYVAGRLHKPVQTIVEHSKVSEAMNNNRNSAVNTALFFLPENFSKKDLYMTIANLSYKGDSRKRAGGEPKDKVKRIVEGSWEQFDNIYNPVIDAKKSIITTLNDDKLQQTFDPQQTSELYGILPLHLRETAGIVSKFYDREILKQQIGKAISEIVGSSSLAQTGKGIISAGIAKSIEYGAAKLKKGRAK